MKITRKTYGAARALVELGDAELAAMTRLERAILEFDPMRLQLNRWHTKQQRARANRLARESKSPA